MDINKNYIKFFAIVLMLFVCACTSKKKEEVAKEKSKEKIVKEISAPKNAFTFAGEKITYEIRKFGMRVGEATLEYLGPTTIDGHETLLLVFRAKAINVYDEEKMYVDPVDYKPVVILRDLDIFGKKEYIKEEYLRDEEKIKITKTVKGQDEVSYIEKPGVIDNIYGFMFRFRQESDFKIGEVAHLTLPTFDLAITLEKATTVKAAKKEYDAYFFNSVPTRYRLWFDTSDLKIPLRIDGTTGFGKTSLIMTSIEHTTHTLTKL